MGDTWHHNNGDKFEYRKNRSGSQRFPRKEKNEGRLRQKHSRRIQLYEDTFDYKKQR